MLFIMLKKKLKKYRAKSSFIELARNNVRTTKKVANKITKKITKTAKRIVTKGNVKKALDQRDIAATCVQAFYENIPPSICWKKGADVGIIPTGCPPNYFRHLALCFENCRPGFSFDGGALCIKGCPPDTTTYPLTCTHWQFPPWKIWTVGRESYFPHSITNFQAPCNDGYYKGGALCYRDCGKIGMNNCGIGMCSADGPSCGAGIATMVTDFLVGLAKGVSFVLSFGTSSAAQGGIAATKASLKKLASKAGNAIKKGFTIMKNIATNAAKRKIFKDKIKKKSVLEKLKKYMVDQAITNSVSTICGSVGDALLDKSATKNENSGLSIDSLDVLGIGDINQNCSNASNSNDRLACSKSILSSLDNIDPTGLCAMASAFMQPICDV